MKLTWILAVCVFVVSATPAPNSENNITKPSEGGKFNNPIRKLHNNIK